MKTQSEGTQTMKVVVTRSKEGNADLTRKLTALGFRVVAVETMSFLPPEDWLEIDASLSNLPHFDWLVLTSAIGADHFIQRMRDLSLELPWKGKPAVAAVGAKTSEALGREGIRVDFVPSEYLTRVLADELPRNVGKKVLLLRADIADPAVVASLTYNGFHVYEHAIYRTTPEGTRVATEELADVDAIIFASPSAVRGFVATQSPTALSSMKTKGVLAACIGPVTAKAAKESGFEHILTSRIHTFDGLIEELNVAEADV